MKYGKKAIQWVENSSISLSDVYKKCDLQYKGEQNEWIEINVLNVVFTMNLFINNVYRFFIR